MYYLIRDTVHNGVSESSEAKTLHIIMMRIAQSIPRASEFKYRYYHVTLLLQGKQKLDKGESACCFQMPS